jgi:antitoxin HigA-1
MPPSVTPGFRFLLILGVRLNSIQLATEYNADTAFRLAPYLGTTPEFWINFQARYDLDVAERTLRRRIEREVTPRAA